MGLLRPNVERMDAYRPGEQPQGGPVIKLNTNENPAPAPAEVVEAIVAETKRLHLYPDPLSRELRATAGRVFGFDPAWIVAGNGSDDLLTMIIRAFVGENDAVACPYPTYVLYKTLTEIQNGRLVEMDFREDYGLPMDLARADARVAFLANPNSPSGTLAAPADLDAFCRAFRGVVVIDEAYVDFADRDCLELVRRFPNVVVLRSFSKSFSMAGARLGLGFAQPALIDGMFKVKDSYNVNRLTQAAGIAALKNIGLMRRNAEAVKETRRYTTNELERLGFFVYPSQANFVLARFGGGNARWIYEALKARGILVRYFDARRLDDCLRISIGKPEEMRALIEALASLLKAGKNCPVG